MVRTQDELKRMAAHRAVEEVQSGMVLGLGTGSTATYAIQRIGELWRRGSLVDLVCVPTSRQTAALAGGLGLPLGSIESHPRLDLAIDGADEVDPELDLIKGLGGALLWEKRVESAADRLIIIVDEGKLVERLGQKSPLPVEVTVAAWKTLLPWLESLGCEPQLRGGAEAPYITDNGNAIVDCRFADGISDANSLAVELDGHPDVTAHGLFLGMASSVVVARGLGVRVLERKS